MKTKTTATSLALVYTTPDHWGPWVLRNPLALLSDHAYLERKAASNALALLNRWVATATKSERPEIWTTTLSAIARDETMHLNQVLRLLQERGGKLERLHRSSYASDLRALVRNGQGPLEVADMLLVSALIEARSCERFEILSRSTADKQLASFYEGLWAAEQGHYKTFFQLAEDVLTVEELHSRWEEMRQAEALIIQNQPLGPGLHSRAPHKLESVS